MQKALLYDPYLATLGGGERYVLTLADILVQQGWEVDLVVQDDSTLGKVEARLGISTAKMSSVYTTGRGRGYDLVFWLSDGSIPLLLGKRNILHFQTPFHAVGGRSILNRLKLMKMAGVICNSHFTKKWIDREYGVASEVVHPPVDVEGIKPLEKENIILNVGRFSTLQQYKGQDVLIEVFRQMYQEEVLKDWRLVLVGGSDIGADRYLAALKRKIRGYPIEIRENIAYNDLKILYGKAKLFWSATGYGIDENREPEKVEHFGISVVEAMAAGCVSLVVQNGGYRETIQKGINGYFWRTKADLVNLTKQIASGDLSEISGEAVRSSKSYSTAVFKKSLLEFVRK